VPKLKACHVPSEAWSKSLIRGFKIASQGNQMQTTEEITGQDADSARDQMVSGMAFQLTIGGHIIVTEEIRYDLQIAKSLRSSKVLSSGKKQKGSGS
jgi:hypothetical protein